MVDSFEHIMRDVNSGWIIRYTHANVASFFFIFVYMHVGKGLYYGLYKAPRVLLWSISVIYINFNDGYWILRLRITLRSNEFMG